MEIKKIIKKCLVKMGLDGVDFDQLTAEQEETITKLVDALNVAYAEAVTAYMPLTTDEKVVSVDGVIDCAELSKQMVHPVRLVDKNGAKHRYRIMPTLVVTDFDGEGVLTYAYAPDEYALEDSLDDIRFTAEILAEGALGVYYFALRAFDLSAVHDDNFREAVKKMKYKGREMVIKERRWSA